MQLFTDILGEASPRNVASNSERVVNRSDAEVIIRVIREKEEYYNKLMGKTATKPAPKPATPQAGLKSLTSQGTKVSKANLVDQ